MLKRFLSTLSLAALIAACGAISAGPSKANSHGDGAFQQQWEELIKAARAEGQLNIILFAGLNLQEALPAFEREFGVRVNFFTGSGRQHAERILAERRAGRYTIDGWIGGANTGLTMLMPNNVLAPVDELLIHPDVTDLSKWFQNRHIYTDPEGRYIFTWGGSPSHIVYLNTNLVDPNEIRSYEDLLNPKWKGKIVATNPSRQGSGASTVPLYLMPEVGEQWFVRWANEMQPTLVENTRQGAEWVAIGRFPIGMFGLSDEMHRLRAQGFPVIDFMPHPMKEGEVLTASANNLMVLDNAPNPNALKLFVNWMLTRDVQQEFIRVGLRKDSLRNDIDNTVIEPQYRIDRNADYYVAYADPVYQTEQRRILGRIGEIMKEAGFN